MIKAPESRSKRQAENFSIAKITIHYEFIPPQRLPQMLAHPSSRPPLPRRLISRLESEAKHPRRDNRGSGGGGGREMESSSKAKESGKQIELQNGAINHFPPLLCSPTRIFAGVKHWQVRSTRTEC